MSARRDILAAVLATVLGALLLGPGAVPEVHAELQILDRVLATVEDQVVLLSQFSTELEQAKSDLRARRSPLPPEETLRTEVLEQLILRSLQLQRGKRAGVIISDEELTRAAEGIAADRDLTLQQLRTELEKHGHSWQHYRDRLREQLIIREVQRNSVRRNVHISEAEVERFLASEQGRTLTPFSHHLLYARQELSPSAATAERQQAQGCIDAFASGVAAGEDFMAGSGDRNCRLRTVDLGWRGDHEVPTLFEPHIATLDIGEFSPVLSDRNGLHVIQLADRRGGNQQIVDQFEVSHILLKPSIVEPEQQLIARLEEFRQRTTDGENFADLARLYSQDPGTKQEGGSLGWVTPGSMHPDFEQYMRTAAIETVSEPFETPFGWHILMVSDRRQLDIGPQRLRDRAYGALFDSKSAEELNLWLSRLREEAHVEIRW